MGQPAIKDRLTKWGVWTFTDALSSNEAGEFARRVESLGYGALWVGETFGRDPFATLAALGVVAQELVLATGIASIFQRHPGAMKQAAMTLAEQTDDRFVLGLGVSHQPIVDGLRKLDYGRPLEQMRHYLGSMNESFYMAPAPASPPATLIAALGPRMLELARDCADGAHPYFTTPEHTAEARRILGPDKLLCVEQKVLLTSDETIAREAAQRAIGTYAGLPNYRNSWKRLGFTEDEINVYSPRFVDAIVAWGSDGAVRERLTAHIEAGADHVCVQAIDPGGAPGPDLKALEALAPA